MKNKALHSGFIMLIVVFTAVCLFTFVSIVLVSTKQTQTQSDLIVERQESYYRACSNAANAIAESLGNDGSYEKTFIINDDEILCVIYTVKNETYKITKWQVINTTEWMPDAHVNLLN